LLVGKKARELMERLLEVGHRKVVEFKPFEIKLSAVDFL
jgi:hypothetical protein